MAAQDRHTRLSGDGRAALEHPGQQVERELVHRPRDKVQRSERPATHRIDVGEGVRRGDPTPIECIIDDGREEIDRLHDRRSSRQNVDGGIVAGGRRNEHLARVLGWGQEAQDLGQIARGELAGSTSAVAEPCEPHLLRDAFGHAVEDTPGPDQGLPTVTSSPVRSGRTLPVPALGHTRCPDSARPIRPGDRTVSAEPSA